MGFYTGLWKNYGDVARKKSLPAAISAAAEPAAKSTVSLSRGYGPESYRTLAPALHFCAVFSSASVISCTFSAGMPTIISSSVIFAFLREPMQPSVKFGSPVM
jgi:hypothetical protein